MPIDDWIEGAIEEYLKDSCSYCVLGYERRRAPTTDYYLHFDANGEIYKCKNEPGEQNAI